MKVAFIIPSLANKGPIIQVRLLVDYLIGNDVYCEIFYFDEIRDLDFPCPTQRISFFQVIDFKEFDIIHSHLFRPDLYCAIHKFLGHFKSRIISTIHTAIYDDLGYTYGTFKSKVLVFLWERSLLAMNHIVVLSSTAKHYYNSMKFKNLSIISNGLTLSKYQDPIIDSDALLINELKKKYTLLGTVCSLDKRKGLEQIINLLIKKEDYAFIIIGDGPESLRLIKLARSHHVNDRFKILGYRQAGYRYLPFLDLFVIPSRSEGIPMALLEAMAAKVPVVCSKIPAFINEFPGDQFSFFELDNTYSLKQACEYALFNSETLTKLALINFEAEFTLNIMGENYFNLYKLLLNRI